MSTNSRAIHNLSLNQDGGFSYSKPGSKATYRTPHEHVATKALGQAAAVARAQRARREADLKRQAAADAEQKALDAEKAANLVQIGEDAKNAAEGEKKKTGFFDSLKAGWSSFVAFMTKPLGKGAARPASDPYLVKAASTGAGLAAALENTDEDRPPVVQPPDQIRAALAPAAPVVSSRPQSAAKPVADQPAKDEPLKPGQVEAEEKQQAASEKQVEAERKDDLTMQNFSSVEETPEGFRVTFPDKYEMVIAKDSPEAKIFGVALDEVANLTTQYDELLKNVALPVPEAKPEVASVRPPEEMEGVIVRWPDAPGGVPRYALEMAGNKWQALNLSPGAIALLNEMHEKGVLSKATVSMNPQWEVALNSVQVNGAMQPLDWAIDNAAGKITPAEPQAAAQPAPEAPQPSNTESAQPVAPVNAEPAPAPKLSPQEIEDLIQRAESLANERPPVVAPIEAAAPQVSPTPKAEPDMHSVTPNPELNTSEIEVGHLVLLPNKSLCVGLADGLHKLDYQGDTEKFFANAQSAGVSWAGVQRNEQGGLELKTFVSTGDTHRSAQEVLGEVPSISLLDDPAEQKEWREYHRNFSAAQRDTASVASAIGDQRAGEPDVIDDRRPDVKSVNPFNSYQSARDGEKLEPVEVDGPGM